MFTECTYRIRLQGINTGEKIPESLVPEKLVAWEWEPRNRLHLMLIQESKRQARPPLTKGWGLSLEQGVQEGLWRWLIFVSTLKGLAEVQGKRFQQM